METLNLKDLKLTADESKDIIRFIAKKRGTTSKNILENINLNKKLTETQQILIKTQQKLIKTQQKLKKSRKSHLELTEKDKKLIEKKQKLRISRESQKKIIKLQKSQIESRELIKSHKPKQKIKPQKQIKSGEPIKLIKPQQELNLQKSEQKKNTKKTIVLQKKLIKSRELVKLPQQPSPERIDGLRKKLNELKYNFSRSEFNKIRKNLYNLKNNKLLPKESTKYLNELDKKIINLDKNEDFIGLENVKDLYSILNYKPILIKTGFDNNYLEYGSEGSDSLSLMEYLDLMKPYLEDLINEMKNKGEWKLQLTAKISFVSSKPGSNETRLIYNRSDAIEFMNGSETEEIIEFLYRSLLQNYNDTLQEKMKGFDFVYSGINYFYYDLNMVSICKGASYIESPKWLKDKKATVNKKNDDFKCFQYAITLALNFDKISNHLERVAKLKSFIDNYNWNNINFPSNRKDWNRFEVNNENIALNILYVPFKTRKIEITYKSKYNLVRDNQVTLLMISNDENWHYLAVKSLSRLLRGISSSHDEDYYCLNCFHSYRTENKLNVHKNVCENRNYCKIEIPSNDNNFIKYNEGEKSVKLPFVIYADLGCILKKISTCYNNPDLSSTTKISQHIPSGYSIFTNCTFDKSYNKLSCYRGEDCMKRFGKDLKDHARRIIDFKKKKR